MTDEEMAKESLISYRKEPKWAGKMFMRDENTCYKDGFLAGLKAGRDTAETDLATVAYMQGAEQQKKKADKQLTKAKEIINNCVYELQNILIHKIRNKERIASILDKTEQFLKEISE